MKILFTYIISFSLLVVSFTLASCTASIGTPTRTTTYTTTTPVSTTTYTTVPTTRTTVTKVTY